MEILKYDSKLEVHRSGVVIIIPAFGAAMQLRRCLLSVLRWSPPHSIVLVSDDATPDGSVEATCRDVDLHLTHNCRLVYLRQPTNLGFVGNCNVAIDQASPADVILLNSDTEVSEGWLEGLRSAAYSDDHIATATALTNHGTILSLPYRNEPVSTLPTDCTVDSVARAIRHKSLRIRPHIPTAIGHCVYIKRSAFDLVGKFSNDFAPGYGEEIDFSQRCLQKGLGHVAADDVFVYHKGSSTFSARATALQHAHETLIAQRYPYYHAAITSESLSDNTPLSRALRVARSSFMPLRILIDGSSIGPEITGTAVQLMGFVQAMSRRQRVHVCVALHEYCNGHVLDVLTRTGVEIVDCDSPLLDKNGKRREFDIVHRPAQVGHLVELKRLRNWGSVIIITQLDLIAYRNPGYFESYDAWAEYREATKMALASAAKVIFISNHAAREAVNEDIVIPERIGTVYLGVDHAHSDVVQDCKPSCHIDLENTPYVLVLGADFCHKNRLFALKVMEHMILGGFGGRLVLAGPQASPGSSRWEEDEYLSLRPGLSEHVVRMGGMSEGEKRWLLKHAALVMAPSTYEGFGMVPFEAALVGVPSLFAPQTAYREVAPAGTALIVPWDAVETARRALRIMSESGIRESIIERLRIKAQEYTWERAAEALMSIYYCALAAPIPSSLVTYTGQDGAQMQSMQQVSDVRRSIGGRVGYYLATWGLLRGTLRGARALTRRWLVKVSLAFNTGNEVG